MYNVKQLHSQKGSFFDFEYFFKKVSIQPHSTILELGCSSGFFTIGIAQYAHKGTVFALDNDSSALNYLRFHSAHLGLDNIAILEQDVLENNIKIPANTLDFVFATNFFSFFSKEELESMLISLKKRVKKGGKLIVTQWDAGAKKMGFNSFTREHVEKISEHFEPDFAFKPSQYMISTVWKKK